MENWECSTKSAGWAAEPALYLDIGTFSFGFPSGTSVGVLTDKHKEYLDKKVKSNGIE
jgi:hypothetical protein